MIPVVNVQVLDFKTTCGSELVTPNEDGSYTVLINARMSYETQRKALLHALGHILNDDFEKENVQEIESAAHEINLLLT